MNDKKSVYAVEGRCWKKVGLCVGVLFKNS